MLLTVMSSLMVTLKNHQNYKYSLKEQTTNNNSNKIKKNNNNNNNNNNNDYGEFIYNIYK